MSTLLIPDPTQQMPPVSAYPVAGLTEETKAARRMGSSTMVRALGLMYPIALPGDAYRELTGQGDQAAGPQAEAGNWFEYALAVRGARELGLELERNRGVFVHPEHAWATTTPDYFLVTSDRSARLALQECKDVNQGMAEKWRDDFNELYPPIYVTAQVQWHLGVLQAFDWCQVSACVNGVMCTWIIERDEDAFGVLLEGASEFWNVHVLGRVEPAMDGSEKTAKRIEQRFRKSNGIMRVPRVEEVAAAAELASLKQKLAAIDERATAIENALKLWIGESEGLEGIAIWSTARGRVSWKNAAADLRKAMHLYAWGQSDELALYLKEHKWTIVPTEQSALREALLRCAMSPKFTEAHRGESSRRFRLLLENVKGEIDDGEQ